MNQAAAEKIEWTEAEKEIWRRKPAMTVSQWAETGRVVVDSEWPGGGLNILSADDEDGDRNKPDDDMYENRMPRGRW